MQTHSQSAGGSAVAGADQKLVDVIERNIYERIKGQLPEFVHDAVTSAIIGAAANDEVKPTNKSTRPAAGGRCAAVWDMLDKLSAEGTVPTLQEIKKVARRRKWNENNTRIEYYRWRADKGIRRQATANA